ncbi:hypothetical protein MBRA1_001826 [Malassezia brasiliensis]|uniref:AB hydrolase-1 domain-containing protein n=1 Tax=Malassezia brasiliensis TaxID=1821822 RepID=A0AAF0DSZ0_9BASI|nr:hypothetical protein MBRA1_001826 [Malassezia brasiliensis]
MFKNLLNKGEKKIEKLEKNVSGDKKQQHGHNHHGQSSSGHKAGAGAAAGAGAGVGGAGAAYQHHHHSSGAAVSGGSQPSVTQVDVAGLPVNVYGLNNLTPGSGTNAPDVCISIHMHGRTGSAKNEDGLARELYQNTMDARQSIRGRTRDFLLVTFDSRDHGQRKTNPEAQKSWKEGNKTHAVDMYGMIRGTADDTSFIAQMLPAYLFPNDERRVSLISVTGKSLGGHSVWQVLAHDPLIRVGVPFIGCPDFQKLIAVRARNSGLEDVPPAVPGSLRALMQRVDPAEQPYREAGPRNPFYGKKICACLGADDHLVRVSYAQEFLEHLTVAPPGSDEARQSLQVYIQPNTGHKVTSEMLRLGGQWLAQWALPY